MLKWFGTVSSVAGSFLVGMTFTFVGYCLFIAGAVSWLWVGYKTRDKALIILNGFFMLANMIGLYNAMV